MSGSAARKSQKARRDAQKRTKRTANQQRYAALRDSGMNSKSVRAKRNAIGARKIRRVRNRKRHVRYDTSITLTRAVSNKYNLKDQVEMIKYHPTWRQTHNQISEKQFINRFKK